MTKLQSRLVTKRLAFISTLFLAFILWQWISTFNRDNMQAPRGSIHLERAITDEEQRLGLSKRPTMAKESGMLFVFKATDRKHCMWMSDMNFPIDVVWIDENKRVVSVVENLKPETYPETFCPDKPVKYFLEVSAGRAEELGVKSGVQLEFSTD